MLISRRLSTQLDKLGRFFPAISLTGPRQAGKTTLLKELYPDYRYVSLENPATRIAAQRDPLGFLEHYDDRVIFDEAQRFPELFSYLQGMIDGDRRPGRFILSGSQNFLLRKNITQTLAGRVGIAKLLPLDNQELRDAGLLPQRYPDAIFQGGYPGRIDLGIDPETFYASYLASYVERDVSELISATNLDVFQQFLQTCAIYSGQTLNLTKIANEVGISVPTVSSWIGILEQSYVVFRLRPFFRNLGKRLTKAPKLYFYDTGLLCFLLGIYGVAEIDRSPLKGSLFENLLIADAFKSFHHQGMEPRFYHYRDQQQQEVDLIYEQANLTRMWEIKSTYTFRPRLLTTLERVAGYWDRPTQTNLLYAGDAEHLSGKSTLINWRNVVWQR
jgi:predicted AAA+ superfamily ATPase